jgi:hypothetical protein
MKSLKVGRLGMRIRLAGLSVLFAATSGQAAEACEKGAAMFERVATRTPAADATPATAPLSVQDNVPQLSQAEQPMGPYLALHCEAISRLLVGQAMAAYSGPACGGDAAESALP